MNGHPPEQYIIKNFKRHRFIDSILEIGLNELRFKDNDGRVTQQLSYNDIESLYADHGNELGWIEAQNP